MSGSLLWRITKSRTGYARSSPSAFKAHPAAEAGERASLSHYCRMEIGFGPRVVEFAEL
jgi:hypothetical protein